MNDWHQCKEGDPLPANVRQVAIWLIDSKSKVILVSQDCINWHLPSGELVADETPSQAATRIFRLLTGLDIKPYLSQLKPLGYSKAKTNATLHLRLVCDFDKSNSGPCNPVAYVKAVPLKSLNEAMPHL